MAVLSHGYTAMFQSYDSSCADEYIRTYEYWVVGPEAYS